MTDLVVGNYGIQEGDRSAMQLFAASSFRQHQTGGLFVKRKVEVTLLGKRFTVRSEKDEAYVHTLANFVARRFEELQRSTRTVSTHDLAILVALNIADDLFQAEERASDNREEVQSRTERLLDNLRAAMEQDNEAAQDEQVVEAVENEIAIMDQNDAAPAKI
ncbi:MAG: cell division protein ZapA [Deltaproteobacteria bacterium]|nr:cell division protein ZapA [Deltaproteobacteria bacterium]